MIDQSNDVDPAEPMYFGFDRLLTKTEVERTISAVNTLRWWKEAHVNTTAYHERFRGYCPQCEQEN